jgi:hypothetical protein
MVTENSTQVCVCPVLIAVSASFIPFLLIITVLCTWLPWPSYLQIYDYLFSYLCSERNCEFCENRNSIPILFVSSTLCIFHLFNYIVLELCYLLGLTYIVRHILVSKTDNTTILYSVDSLSGWPKNFKVKKIRNLELTKVLQRKGTKNWLGCGQSEQGQRHHRYGF